MEKQFQKSKRKIYALDERSSEVNEIMGKAPNWVIRFGTSIVFVIVILLVWGASIISYNDVIRTEIEITSGSPPIHLKIEKGTSTEILVAQGQEVKAGEPLAILDTIIHFKDVEFLRNNMEQYTTQLVDSDSLYGLFPAHLMLGKMQQNYIDFTTAYENYIILKQAQGNLKVPKEKPKSEIAFQQLARSYQILLVELQQWDHEYVVRTPIAGMVSYGDIEQKDYVGNQVENVWLMIIPIKTEGIIGKIKLSENNSQRVKVGQKVMIKPLGYSFEEWGSLKGQIKNIIYVPNTGREPYLLEVKIDGLTTSYGKKIPFEHEMKGAAIIIVEELTVFQRMFYGFQKLFK